MRTSFLFATAAMMFAAVSVQADITLRTAPLPENQQGFLSGDEVEYYLWNTNAQKFFTEGNAWGTQASVGNEGLKVKFTKYANTETGVEWDEKTYLFNDYSLEKNAWKMVFFDSETAMFVDRGSQGNYFWQVEDNGSTFRLYAGDINPTFNWAAADADQNLLYAEKYVGLDVTNVGGTALLPFLTVDDNHYIDWTLVDADSYEAYQAKNNVYLASEQLRVAIEEAKEMGINTDEWDAIYNNPEATVEQLNAATEAVKQAIVDFGANNASVDNPADMTTSLANPNFDNASSTGWSGTAPNMTGSGSHGPANVAEHYNKTFDTYQNLTDMPDGVYAFEVTAFYRGQLEDYLNHTNYNAYIYAINGTDTLTQEVANPWEAMNTTPMAGATYFGPVAAETSAVIDGVTYYIPNDPSAGRLYFEAGYYKARLMMASNNGKLRLGIKKDVAVAGDWTVFDSFKLTFYGNATEAYRFWANEMKQQAFDYSTMEDLLVTTSYLNAYNEALDGYDQAETYDAILAVNANVAVATDSIKANIQAWADFVAKVAEAEEVAADDQYADSDDKGDLSDYTMDAQDIIGDAQANGGAMTTQELLDAIAYMDQLIKKVRNGLKEDGDATALLVNPGYESGSTGWQGGPALGSGGGNTCAEAYDKANFDVYQVVENAPVGVYEIEVQGFFRLGRPNFENQSTAAYTMYLNGQQIAPAFVYVNDMTTALKCIYDEHSEGNGVLPNGTTYTQANIDEPDPETHYQYPNTMTQAAEAFAAGMYKSSAYGLVANEGDAMRVGVKGKLSGPNWAIWDNFKLTFRGKNPVAVKAVIDFIIPQAQADLDGDVYCNIDVMTALETAIETAQAESARASLDTKEELYAALTNLVKARAALQASKEVYATLKPAIDELEAALSEYSETAGAETYAEASNLYENVLSDYLDGKFADEDIPAKIEEINDMIARLKVNENEMALASDANPVDCTHLIVNPSYDDRNNTGWSGDAPGFDNNATNAEMFQKNFNYYQDLVALPEGTYQVTVTGFYRHGSAADDYRLFNQNPNEGNNFFLYAETYEGEDTIAYSAPMERLAKYAEPYTKEGGLKTDWTAAKEATDTEDGFQVPNRMITAENQFQEGFYTDNSIIVKVGQDGKLRIGLKKSINHDNDWCIWDSWTLTYFGKESSKNASDDVATAITSVEDAATVSRQIYNVNGVRTNGLHKGVNIVRETMSDGSVRIVKITIR